MPRRFSDVVVDAAKLRNYCLNDAHPRGRHKARVFRSRLGLTASDVDLLQQALRDAALLHQDQLQPTFSDEFGQRFNLDFEMTTSTSSAVIRSAWIVLVGGDVLRLISCYVL